MAESMTPIASTPVPAGPFKLVTLTELAVLAKVSRTTLYDWMRRGRVPPGVEVTDAPGNARYGVYVATLNAWVEARAKEPVS